VRFESLPPPLPSQFVFCVSLPFPFRCTRKALHCPRFVCHLPHQCPPTSVLGEFFFSCFCVVGVSFPPKGTLRVFQWLVSFELASSPVRCICIPTPVPALHPLLARAELFSKYPFTSQASPPWSFQALKPRNLFFFNDEPSPYRRLSVHPV